MVTTASPGWAWIDEPVIGSSAFTVTWEVPDDFDPFQEIYINFEVHDEDGFVSVNSNGVPGGFSYVSSYNFDPWLSSGQFVTSVVLNYFPPTGDELGVLTWNNIPEPEGRVVVPGVVNSGCVLGCPETYTVLVTNRCGTATVCELDHISDLTYGRVLDDTSEAIIVMDLPSGGGTSTCCDCVGNVRSWIHSVMILRDNELVWGPGPVVNVLYKKTQVAITARDVSAWLDVRVIHNDMDFTEEDPLVVAQSIIDDAMAPDDPCDIAGSTYVQVPATLGVIDREYFAEDPTQYAGDAFRELARTAMDYTVIGNSIMMGEPLSFGPYVTLLDEDFMVDIEVEERGLEAGTKWTVQSEVARGEAGGLDPYYGLIEQLVEEAEIEDDDQAAVVAEDKRLASNPAPLYVNVPDGARLAPTAAVCFEQLVPGTLVNVNLRGLCREVYAQLKLTAVSVHVANGDEEVGITLSPLGTAVGEAEA